jgi:hypothetical protein
MYNVQCKMYNEYWGNYSRIDCIDCLTYQANDQQRNRRTF